MRQAPTALLFSTIILVALGLACSSGTNQQAEESGTPAPGTTAGQEDLAARQAPETETPAAEAPAAEETGAAGEPEMSDSEAGDQATPPDAAEPEPEHASPEPEQVSAQPDEPSESSPESDQPVETAPAPVPEPEREIESEDSAIQVDVPDGPVRVDAPKEGLTYVGVDKCKTCHKVQYTSWMESKHAALTPPLDCESCHGPGSEYRSLKVMKDPAAAEAAGLVKPDAAFCANCHVGGWTDAMLEKAHAHKEVQE